MINTKNIINYNHNQYTIIIVIIKSIKIQNKVCELQLCSAALNYSNVQIKVPSAEKIICAIRAPLFVRSHSPEIQDSHDRSHKHLRGWLGFVVPRAMFPIAACIAFNKPSESCDSHRKACKHSKDSWAL